ncbi:MAG: hypothetical protein CME55_00280 [Halieaceae bacterium]|nr:hypothetical protein [Halieaceae bacterium]
MIFRGALCFQSSFADGFRRRFFLLRTCALVSHTQIELDTMRRIIRMEESIQSIAESTQRIAEVLERLESFFIATSVEEVQKRVEDMHNGRA